jgi:hypothetical protein
MEMKQYICDEWSKYRESAIYPLDIKLAFMSQFQTENSCNQAGDGALYIIIEVNDDKCLYITDICRTFGIWSQIQSVEDYDRDIIDEIEEMQESDVAHIENVYYS